MVHMRTVVLSPSQDWREPTSPLCPCERSGAQYKIQNTQQHTQQSEQVLSPAHSCACTYPHPGFCPSLSFCPFPTPGHLLSEVLSEVALVPTTLFHERASTNYKIQNTTLLHAQANFQDLQNTTLSHRQTSRIYQIQNTTLSQRQACTKYKTELCPTDKHPCIGSLDLLKPHIMSHVTLKGGGK